MKRRKIAMVTAFVVATGISIGLIPAHADSVKESIPIVQDGGKGYVSMEKLTDKMSGKVERYDGQSEHYTTYKIKDKSIKIWDGYACAFVNGAYVPYETREVQGFTVPAWVVPMQVNGDVLVPVAFVEKNLGVKVEGDKVTFEVTKTADSGSNSTATNSGTTNNTANNGSGDVETHNRPISNTDTSNSTNTGSGSTTKPSANGGGSTQPTKPPAQQQKVYTGSQVKQKLYGLGFKESSSGSMVYSTSSNLNDDASKYATYYVEGGNVDARLVIVNSDPTFDQKLRMAFGYILPSSGGRLYSILDNPNVKNQTLKMDGRTVQIYVRDYGIIVDFGPIIK